MTALRPWTPGDVLLCGIRAALHEEDRVTLRAMVHEGVDWTPVIESSNWHQVTPTLHWALEAAGSDLLPPELSDAFRVFDGAIRDRYRQLSAALVSVLTNLAAAGVRSIPFKGPTLATRIYPDPTARLVGDLDVFVARDSRDRVLSLLHDLGFAWKHDWLRDRQRAATLGYWGQAYLHDADRDIGVEPHWALGPRVLSIDVDYGQWFERAIPMRFGGVDTERFDPADELIGLCIHGAKEEWARLKWIIDVHRFVAATPALDWDAVWSRSMAAGTSRIVKLGLALTRMLLSTSLPDEVATLVTRDEGAGRLAALAAARIRRGGHPPRSVSQLSRFRVSMRERWRDRLRYVTGIVFVPHHVHFEQIDLPDWLFAGYYPWKVVSDYLVTPGWRFVRRMRARPASGLEKGASIDQGS